ncbi:hypothetical protein MSG28_015919 [Choristoneura fumiferana]|uniref:Uncharacterized protein n=1 Tax=Choristoneura fumiferana TaxID=7141 RepID=A0ACC0K570_CHOFU|nr:hypothetical protein MSG28_015919 [Choristoneura fumiferana]
MLNTITVFEEDDSIGVENSDFVLYVSAVETERCSRGLTVAYASHCQQESALDRPVAGHANFCPGELSTKYRDLPSLLSTVQHEMLHALGFSVSLFAFYRLQIHKWSDRVVRNITRKKWMIRGGYVERTFHMIVTPRVVKENEAMTGTHTQNSVFSRLTFALMEDTGWYRAEYSRAAPLAWGRGLGCGFATTSCKQWLNTQRLSETKDNTTSE